MKTKNVLFMLLIAAGAVSCKYDDGELWNKVNSLEDRLEKVEESLTTMNADISSLSTIVNAIQNNVFVKSVKQTENGYIIEFSDGKTATITNGKDGAAGKDAPVIGVGEFEGKYYWKQTIDGVSSWLLDESGNKIPVTGKDAVTPLLKVNASGYWMISYDGGISYTEVKDENGNPVKAVGEDGQDGQDGQDGTAGDSFFANVEFTSTELVLTLKDGTVLRVPLSTNDTGIPSDTQAEKNPTIDQPNTNIPNFITELEEGSDGKVMRMSLTGIQTPDNNWMKLYGTGDARQNVWIEIDGKPKGFTVINSEEVASRSSVVSKAKADIVFLVDNSGSMGEEANAIARDIIEWSGKLSQTMDVRFGCVGIDHRYVNGALNITTVDKLHDYLNRSTGTSRTQGFGGPDAAELDKKADSYNTAYGECGGIMLHFADQNFDFREGANRIYVHFTDEPNQANNIPTWSVESVNANSEYYIWGTDKGTIHTIFSDLGRYPETWSGWTPLLKEKPWLFSDYTGGTKIIDAPSSFEGVSLDSLPVTGAILNSYILRINVTPDLLTGTHTVKITILSEDGSVKAEKIFTNVTFTI